MNRDINSTVIAELGEYEVVRYESTFTTRAALFKGLELLLPFDFQDWVDNPSMEYWLKEYSKDLEGSKERIMRDVINLTSKLSDIDSELRVIEALLEEKY